MADILTNSTMLNLDISIWTGKAKLQRTEVDDSALPPEELVTLGSKKIFDPAKLKSFHGIKSNAFAACNRYGVKCMGGWLVSNSSIDELVNKLSAQRGKWDDAVRQFLATYQMECDDWLAANPEWASILANALPRQSEIARRFNFGWQVFHVIPAPTDSVGDQTQDELDIVPTRAIEKMAKEIEGVLDVYAPNKTFRVAPLQRLAGMARSLAFSSPEVDKLGDILNQLANTGSLDIAQIMLGKLADPKELAVICEPGKDAQNILDSVVVLQRPVSQPQSAPEPVQEVQQPMTKTLPDIGSLIADAQSVLKQPLMREPQASEPVAQPIQQEAQPDEVEKQDIYKPDNTLANAGLEALQVAPEPAPVQTNNEQAMSNMLGAIDSEGLW